MYDIIKNVIMRGRYELSDMLRKLDTLWLQGDLTDQQKAELEGLAREHADPAMTATLTKRVEDLERRVDTLEAAEAPGGDTASSEWPEYAVGRSYRNGDKVTFEGARYICTLPEHADVCVWSPKDYPAYWRAA